MTEERQTLEYNLGQKLAIATLRPIFTTMVRLDVDGLDNIPAAGPAILMILGGGAQGIF